MKVSSKTNDPAIFIIVGWIMFIGGILALLNFIRKAITPAPKGFIKTQGKIMDYTEHNKDPKFLYPVISFSFNGKDYTFTDKKHVFPHQKSSGKTVTLYFNPANPQEAQKKLNFFSYELFSSFFILIFGAGWLVLVDRSIQQKFMELFTRFNLSNQDVIVIMAMGMFFMFAVFACFMFFGNRKGFIKTHGVISGYTEAGTNKGRQLYAPKITFTLNGENIEFTESLFARSSKPVIGKVVKIMFNPNNPKEAVQNTWLNYLFPVGFIVFIIIFVLIYILGD